MNTDNMDSNTSADEYTNMDNNTTAHEETKKKILDIVGKLLDNIYSNSNKEPSININDNTFTGCVLHPFLGIMIFVFILLISCIGIFVNTIIPIMFNFGIFMNMIIPIMFNFIRIFTDMIFLTMIVRSCFKITN